MADETNLKQASAIERLNDEIISAMDLMDMPDVHKEMIDNFPHLDPELNASMFDVLRKIGGLHKKNQPSYSLHERMPYEQPPVVAAVTAGAGNTLNGYTSVAGDVLLEIATESHVDVNGTNRSMVREHDIIEFSNGAQGYVKSKGNNTSGNNLDQIIVSPVDGAGNDVINGAKVGQPFIFIENAQPEGSDVRDEQLHFQTRVITNRISIARQDFKVTGEAMPKMSWIPFRDENGRVGRFNYLHQQHDIWKKFLVELNRKILVSKIATGLTDKNGNTIETSRGIVPHVQEFGNHIQYASAINKDTFNTVKRTNTKNYGGDKLLAMVGENASIAIEEWAHEYFKEGGIIYNQSNGGEVDVAKLGLKRIGLTGLDIIFDDMRMFNDPNSLGVDSYGYKDMMLTLPIGKEYDQKGDLNSCFGIAYQPMQGKGAREHLKIWEHGGASDAGTNGKNEKVISMMSYCGAHILGTKKFQLYTKIA